MRKSILLINKSYSLSKVFKKALEDKGMEVVSFFDLPIPTFRRSFMQKYVNIYRRLFFRDKTYLLKLEQRHYDNALVDISKQIRDKYPQKFDYTLFFRADLFPKVAIENIKSVSNYMVSYQYDGMEVCGKILSYKDLFDRIFVFDHYDLMKYRDLGFQPLTNCWFPDEEKESPKQWDFFYVGTGVEDRKIKMKRFAEYLFEYNFTLKAFLTIQKFQDEEDYKGIKFTHSGLPYEENMQYVKSSSVIIDFKLPYHEGLSFRFFEAMNYEKKIITNNFSVKNYDFYHPDNVLICDFEDFSEIPAFMAKPYVKISEKIREKYGFENWIKYVLDDGDYEKIELF